jgi:GNAT superfamily N-acetyltransferase
MPLRQATTADAELICALVLELAEYERAPAGAAVTTPEAIRQALDPAARPRLDAIIAETDDGEPAGCALYFRAFSSWRANWGFYLEDLFVRPALRGRGFGFQLLRAVAATAVRAGADRLDWVVLDWNTPAIEFYERVGARAMTDWTLMRLSGAALEALADGAEAGAAR